MYKTHKVINWRNWTLDLLMQPDFKNRILQVPEPSSSVTTEDPPLCLWHLETSGSSSLFPCVWINIAQGSLYSKYPGPEMFPTLGAFGLWDTYIHICLYIFTCWEFLSRNKSQKSKVVPPNPHLSICEHLESRLLFLCLFSLELQDEWYEAWASGPVQFVFLFSWWQNQHTSPLSFTARLFQYFYGAEIVRLFIFPSFSTWTFTSLCFEVLSQSYGWLRSQESKSQALPPFWS